jgi:hypothetical protein
MERHMVHAQENGAGQLSASVTHYKKTRLIARGWTKAMIDQLLGAPDRVERPHGDRIVLFAVDRVHAAEQTAEFIRRKEQAKSRTQLGRATSHARRAATLAAVSEVEFSVPIMRISDLTGYAIAAFNRTEDNPAWRASMKSDRTLLAYLSVHWLRSQNSAYARAIASTKGRPGRWEAYYRLRAKLLDVIALAYPHLAEECAAQRADERAPDDSLNITVEDLESATPDRDELSMRFDRKLAAARAAQYSDSESIG